jgi:DNA polymerase III epsilon subunit-like protein
MEVADLESYISVDVETSGANPFQYSLLSIGACNLCKPRKNFYAELKPVNQNAIPEALQVSGLRLEELNLRGFDPREAMAALDMWLTEAVPAGKTPIFIAFNAPFDWMFVNDYFYRFLGRNPFGHSALDLKAYYMGLKGVSWSETSMGYIGPRYLGDRPLTHNALQDALDQAEIFLKMLEERSD